MAAPAVYSFPENATLRELERERLPILASNYVGNRILPLDEENADTVLWEIRDDIKGMTFAVGSDEEFPLVEDDPLKRYFITPGRYGERMQLDPIKIERMRQAGTYAQPINVGGEMSRMQEKLGIREQILIEYVRWQLLVNGVVNVLRKDGTAIEVARYTPQQYTVPIFWNNYGTAVPLQVLRYIRSAYAGNGHNFGAGAIGFGNAVTLDTLAANTNAADLYGKRMSGLAAPLSLADANSIFLGEGLLKLEYYDETYKDVNGVVQRFIPDGYIVVVGTRPGTGIVAGNYVMTRNGNNTNGAPGIYVNSGVKEEAPRMPWTERGHNGAPKINYLKQILILKVF